MESRVMAEFRESITILESSMEQCLPAVVRIAGALASIIKHGGRVFFCGNGGSAAEAQHLAAELVGKYQLERRALPAIALTTNSSVLTAIANDYDYTRVFSRQVEALMGPNDALVVISTSGKSSNVLEAVRAAQIKGALTVGLTGQNGGNLLELTGLGIQVLSPSTPRIQEAHLLMGHIICGLIEAQLQVLK